MEIGHHAHTLSPVAGLGVSAGYVAAVTAVAAVLLSGVMCDHRSARRTPRCTTLAQLLAAGSATGVVPDQ